MKNIINTLWSIFDKVFIFKIFALLVIGFIYYHLIRAMYLTINVMPLPNIVVGVIMTMLLPLLAVSILERK